MKGNRKKKTSLGSTAAFAGVVLDLFAFFSVICNSRLFDMLAIIMAMAIVVKMYLDIKRRILK